MKVGVLLVIRAVRAFGFGFSAILLGVHLERLGLRAAVIGLVLTIALATASGSGLLSATASRRFGRRLVLGATGVLMAISGLILSWAHQPGLLILASATGMMGVIGTDLGAFLAVEQAILAEQASPGGRNSAFARYSFIGAMAGAAGGLASSFGTDLNRSQLFFLLYAILGIATTLLVFLLPSTSEGANPGVPVFGNVRPLIALSALFFIDALGGGIAGTAVIAYWLHVRFLATPIVLGPAFATMNVIAAISYLASGWLSNRIGLINTMVLAHLPSNILLILVAFSQQLTVALVLLVLRSVLSQVDGPARQAYIVSIVKPSERAGAVAFTSAVQGVALSMGPVLVGAAIQSGKFGLPFVFAGSIKILYDLGLYAGFRRRPGDHESYGRRSAVDQQEPPPRRE